MSNYAFAADRARDFRVTYHTQGPSKAREILTPAELHAVGHPTDAAAAVADRMATFGLLYKVFSLYAITPMGNAILAAGSK